ncbi:helix-turn-helix domain-containing protein [Dehalobacter sp. DCM]|uniref:hypothetical protein n=1 Tax=Dehalobacter sp. DCM TaxID=2907827 RepID=UPI003081F164|nr:helix-turn-helix domain-containing protein [Dehalobacter sp. DCM]
MFQIMLRCVRESCGYSIIEAALHCDLSADEYELIENDASLLTADIMVKIKKLYNNIPLELIYPGEEMDCIRYNRHASELN